MHLERHIGLAAQLAAVTGPLDRMGTEALPGPSANTTMLGTQSLVHSDVGTERGSADGLRTYGRKFPDR